MINHVNQAKQIHSSSSGNRNSLEDIFEDILFYPQPKTTKRKRKADNSPSVFCANIVETAGESYSQRKRKTIERRKNQERKAKDT